VFVLAGFSVLGAAAGRINFTTPRVMGYPPGGDDWEPALASDGQGNVYYLTTHLSGVPGCPACSVDTMVIQVSHDGGRTLTAPSTWCGSWSTRAARPRAPKMWRSRNRPTRERAGPFRTWTPAFRQVPRAPRHVDGTTWAPARRFPRTEVATCT